MTVIFQRNIIQTMILIWIIISIIIIIIIVITINVINTQRRHVWIYIKQKVSPFMLFLFLDSIDYMKNLFIR